MCEHRPLLCVDVSNMCHSSCLSAARICHCYADCSADLVPALDKMGKTVQMLLSPEEIVLMQDGEDGADQSLLKVVLDTVRCCMLPHECIGRCIAFWCPSIWTICCSCMGRCSGQDIMHDHACVPA